MLYLQALVARIWDDGADEKRIDYARDLAPGLNPTDETWMIELLAAHGIARPRGAT